MDSGWVFVAFFAGMLIGWITKDLIVDGWNMIWFMWSDRKK